MKIRPLRDHIVVKRTQEEEKTKGGIIIPDTAKQKPIEGTVIAVGNGKHLKNGKVLPLGVKVASVQWGGQFGGNPATWNVH